MLKAESDAAEIMLETIPDLLKTVLQNPKQLQLPRCSRLLQQWKRWFSVLHGDGCGPVYTVGQYTEWSSASQELMEMPLLTSDATKLTVTIPAIKNKKMRMAGSLAFKPLSSDMGPYLKKLHAALIDGENPLKPKQDDDGD